MSVQHRVLSKNVLYGRDPLYQTGNAIPHRQSPSLSLLHVSNLAQFPLVTFQEHLPHECLHHHLSICLAAPESCCDILSRAWDSEWILPPALQPLLVFLSMVLGEGMGWEHRQRHPAFWPWSLGEARLQPLHREPKEQLAEWEQAGAREG